MTVNCAPGCIDKSVPTPISVEPGPKAKPVQTKEDSMNPIPIIISARHTPLEFQKCQSQNIGIKELTTLTVLKFQNRSPIRYIAHRALFKLNKILENLTADSLEFIRVSLSKGKDFPSIKSPMKFHFQIETSEHRIQ